jgi:hypothetical protein
MSRSTPINLFLLIAARQERKLVRVPKPTIDGELWLSVARKPCASDGTCARLDGRDALSNLVYHTSMLTDEQMTEGIFRTEEFPTEPAALGRARELLEDVDCKTVLVSDNSGEHLSVVGVPLKPGLTAPAVSRRTIGCDVRVVA